VHSLFLFEAVEFAGSHNTLHRSKALKYEHCRVRTSSISADRGDDGIWIFGLAGSFIIVNNVQIPSARLICIARSTSSSTTAAASGIMAAIPAVVYFLVATPRVGFNRIDIYRQD
jgi:hypothetical protein